MNLELTYRNHFLFGYDNDWFRKRLTKEENWIVEYGKSSSFFLNFKEESKRTAQKICESTNKKIFLLFSGGMDSEFMVRSFREINADFEVAIMYFENHYNLHDISFAIVLCEKFRIPYKIYNLNILNFWENNLIEYSELSQCISPQLCATMWLMDQVDGYPVLGSGECLLVKRNQKWYLQEKERIAAWYRFLIYRNKPGCAGFFQYTPEIMISFLKNPMIQDLIQNKREEYLDTKKIKYDIYRHYYRDIMKREKFTGYEKLQHYDWVYRKKLSNIFPNHDDSFYTEYEILCNSLIYKC